MRYYATRGINNCKSNYIEDKNYEMDRLKRPPRKLS